MCDCDIRYDVVCMCDVCACGYVHVCMGRHRVTVPKLVWAWWSPGDLSIILPQVLLAPVLPVCGEVAARR